MPDDLGAPEIYITAIVAIFSEYPPGVGEALSHPVTGSALLPARPTLQDIRRACEAAAWTLGAANRELARQRRIETQLVERPKPLTAEQKDRRRAFVERIQREIAISAAATADSSSNATAITITTT